MTALACFSQKFPELEEVRKGLELNSPQAFEEAKNLRSAALQKNNFRLATLASVELANAYRRIGRVSLNLEQDSIALHYSAYLDAKGLLLSCLNAYAGDLVENSQISMAETLLDRASSLFEAAPAERFRWILLRAACKFKQLQFEEALSFYRQGLELARTSNNYEQEMVFNVGIGRALLYKGEVEGIKLVYKALDYFETNGNYRQASFAANTIASSYHYSFNPEKALEYYLKATAYAEKYNDVSWAASIKLKTGDIYLMQKELGRAEALFLEAERFYDQNYDQLGLALSRLYLARLYTAKGNLEAAELHFTKAENLNAVLQDRNLTISINGYRALLHIRKKNFSKADSFATSSIKMLAETIDKDLVNKAIEKLKEGDNITSTEEAEARVNFHLKSDTGLLRPSARLSDLDSLNLYFGKKLSEDSSVIAKSNKQLLEWETIYQTKPFKDSVKIQKTQLEHASSRLKTRTIIISTLVIVALTLLTGFTFQYINRRRAIKEKNEIEVLQHGIHHRIANDLKIVMRQIRQAELNGSSLAYATLQTRVKAIELLHAQLYQKDAKEGDVQLGKYFDTLCREINTIYESSARVDIHVFAPMELNAIVAGKLGLILTEVVTNSMKHAFAGRESGLINVEAREDGKYFHFVISDNGNGMTVNPERKSFGLKSINGLTNQLNGESSFTNDQGTIFHLTIPKSELYATTKSIGG